MNRAARIALVGCVLATSAGSLASAAAADRIYWGNTGNNTISFAKLDGSGGGNLPTASGLVSQPVGLAIDTAGGRIYWASYDLSKIESARLDGGGGALFDTGSATVKNPDGVALDAVARTLYWANFSDNSIGVAPLDGSGGVDLATGTATVDGPQGVALDPVARRIYWANAGGSDPISFARLDGSGGGEIDPGSATVLQPYGVALDRSGGRVYWANDGGNKISFARLDGSGGDDLPTGAATVGLPIGVAVDHDAGRVYWANDGGNKISFARLDGSGGGDLKTGTATVSGPVFPVLLKAPRPVARPVVSGGSVVGARLTCSHGGWAGDVVGAFLYRAPHAFATSWLRNGHAIAGATKGAFKPGVAGRYRCRVRASNAAGATSQMSVAHAVFAKARIMRARVRSAEHRATFSFESIGGGSGFQCALTRQRKGKPAEKPSFSACKSPKRYEGLAAGDYVFRVRVRSAGGVGPAAKRRIEI